MERPSGLQQTPLRISSSSWLPQSGVPLLRFGGPAPLVGGGKRLGGRKQFCSFGSGGFVADNVSRRRVWKSSGGFYGGIGCAAIHPPCRPEVFLLEGLALKYPLQRFV